MRTVETSPQSTPQTFQMIPHGAYRMTSCAANRMVEATLEWVSPASRTPALLMVAVPRDSELFECLAESGRATLHVVTGSDEPAAAIAAQPSSQSGEPVTDQLTDPAPLRLLKAQHGRRGVPPAPGPRR